MSASQKLTYDNLLLVGYCLSDQNLLNLATTERALNQPLTRRALEVALTEVPFDDDLKRHRVGGRLVTRREIIRSKKCKITAVVISITNCISFISCWAARRTILAA